MHAAASKLAKRTDGSANVGITVFIGNLLGAETKLREQRRILSNIEYSTKGSSVKDILCRRLGRAIPAVGSALQEKPVAFLELVALGTPDE
jgi:hypothetical protein